MMVPADTHVLHKPAQNTHAHAHEQVGCGVGNSVFPILHTNRSVVFGDYT